MTFAGVQLQFAWSARCLLTMEVAKLCAFTLITASLVSCPEEPAVFQHTLFVYGSFQDLITCMMII